MSNRFAPLAHPLWWLSLLVLVINDHGLKGAGLLPGALTGKLSDVTGLVMAPVLVATVVGARRPVTRAMAFAAVALPFSLINLMPEVARGAEALGSAAGLPIRVWCDPTDLWALAALPVAWWTLDDGWVRMRVVTCPWLARAGIAVGAVACMATSVLPPVQFTTSAFIANRTDQERDVRIRWVEANLECTVVRDELGRALDRELFGEGVTFALPPDETLPLERGPAERALGEPVADFTPESPECDAALVQVDGLEDTLVYWSNEGNAVVRQDIEGRQAAVILEEGDRMLSLGTPNGELEAFPGARLRTASPIAHPEPARCEAGTPVDYGWSAPTATDGTYKIETMRRLADGCLALDVRPAPAPARDGEASEPGSLHRINLCVPPWAEIFELGSRIELQSTLGVSPGLEIIAVDTSQRIVVYDDASRIDALPRSVRISPLDCAGERTRCAAYTVPAGLWIGDSIVRPGESIEWTADGMRTRIGLGRAERVAVAPPSCRGARTDVGTRADVVLRFDE